MYDYFKGIFFFFALGFEAQHNVAVHLYKAAIAIPREAFVIGFFDDALYRIIVHPEVQDGIHHAGHGSSGATADRKQQGIFVGTEFHAHDVFHVFNGGFYIAGEQLTHLVGAHLVKFDTGVCSDCKSGGYRNADQIHFGEVCTFTTQQILHIGFTFSVSVTKKVNAFSCSHLSSMRALCIFID